MGYRVVNGKLYPVGDFSGFNSKAKERVVNKSSSKSFEDFLKENIKKEESFNISNHAAERLRDRNISLNNKDMKEINGAINKAEEKGCNECLILYKDMALITSVKNRTVITAMDKNSSKGNVFTNIDSVVIL